MHVSARNPLTLNKQGGLTHEITPEALFVGLRTNISAKARLETLNGREYLVVSARLIVPGVLNGSKGPLYYPPEEVAHNHTDWNGMPLVLRHPMNQEGKPVSARDPEILATHGLGFVFRSLINNGPLDAEAWFDVQRTGALDKTLPSHQQMLPRLKAGKAIELSTGLFTQDFPAPEGSVHNGVKYTHVARNYRPDHLAVLPDEVGACSVNDGCGIHVNTGDERSLIARAFSTIASWLSGGSGVPPGSLPSLPGEDSVLPRSTNNSLSDDTTEPPPVEEPSVNRTSMIQWLTTNCDCWKNKQTVLNDVKSFTDDDIKKLKANAEAALTVNSMKTKQHSGLMARRAQWVLANSWVINADDTAAPKGVDLGELADFFGVSVDPKSDPLGFIKELKGKVSEVMSKLEDATSAEPPPADNPPADTPVAMSSEVDDPNKDKTVNRNKPAGGFDMKQLATLIRTEVSNAVQGVLGDQIQSQKDQYINAILSSERDPEQRTVKLNKLKNKTIGELKELVALLPIHTIHDNRLDPSGMPLYTGAAAGGVINVTGVVDNDDDFNVPVINYQEEAKLRKRQTKTG